MTKFEKNKTTIRGSEGVAVGIGNQVIVVNQKNIHNHGSKGDSSSSAGPAIFGLVLVAGALLAAASYAFARHASAIYDALQIIALAELAMVLTIAIYLWRTDAEEGFGKPLTLSLLCTLGSLAIFFAQSTYRPEFSELASSAHSSKEFWCSLNVYGRQLILLHLTTAVLGFGLGNLTLAVPVLSLAMSFLFSTPQQPSPLASWWLIAVGGILVVGASLLNTPAGLDVWATAINPQFSIGCGR